MLFTLHDKKFSASVKIVTQLPQATPHTKQGPLQAIQIPYSDNAKHNENADQRHGTNNLDRTDRGQEVCSRPRETKNSFTKQRTAQSRKGSPGNVQPDSHKML